MVQEFLKRNPGRISRNTLCMWLKTGEIKSVRIGRKILPPSNCLKRRLEAQEQE